MVGFSSILVANRGEIACRVMRTASALGYRTIAVYSTADDDAPHVLMADDAICIGGPEVGTSYLDSAKILDAAKQTGADAIHPGYGFLSENAAFASACAAAGITFIGPSADAITLMGNKAEAKRRMIAANVPCIPGYEGEDQSDKALVTEATKIGFPIMVKAAAGGGGRGMRLVNDVDALSDAIASARSEAENAFGSGELILERAVIRPRHVEVQVFGDTHGTVIHLGERDCSVQRRHQKVIEEAPCPIMTDDLRARMGAAAVTAAKDIGYVGAGTVEFLLDESGAFYFLEMNTRLQVEHPVTEEVTGLDLVAMQIAVAQGEPLGLSQDDVMLDGHAIEVRLYAEDPAAGFLPATGNVDLWQPAYGDGIRVDAGIAEGQAVSPFYDPMIAKLIAYGATRDEARKNLVACLRDTHLIGVRTNRLFLIDALERSDFVDGRATTAFISDNYPDETFGPACADDRSRALASIIQYDHEKRQATNRVLAPSDELTGWSSSTQFGSFSQFVAEGEATEDVPVTQIIPLGDEQFDLITNGVTQPASLDALGPNWAVVTIGGETIDVSFVVDGMGRIGLSGPDFAILMQDQTKSAGGGGHAAGDGAVLAPMHGRILHIAVEAGQQVAAGQKLAVLEAMKMEHVVEAPIAGTITELLCAIDDQKAANDLLMVIKDA